MARKTLRAILAASALLATAPANGATIFDPDRLPDYPDIASALTGQPIDSITTILGPPGGVETLGSRQFAQYRSLNCLTQPVCEATAPCTLSLTINAADSRVVSAKIDGTILGAPLYRTLWLSHIAKMCNADYYIKLKSLMQDTPALAPATIP